MPEEYTHQKHLVLVVEDSPTQAAQLQFTLENQGYETIVAVNGADALDKLKQVRPSLIISDVVMPIMNGFEFSKSVKAQQDLCNIPIILLTALSEPTEIFLGLESGADHYLLKPLEESAIVSRIGAILADRCLSDSNKGQKTLEISFGDRKYFINPDRIQILDLLLATFGNIARKSKELEVINKQLRDALETNKILRGLIPICSYCKKMRDDEGFWLQVEKYVEKHTELSFSQGACPECIKKHFNRYS